MPASQHQALSDIPLGFYLLIGLAGLTGELWRADIAGLGGKEIIKRIALRWGASAVFGTCTALLAIAGNVPIYAAGAAGGIVACGGADISSALYNRWLKRRLGLADERE